MTKHPLMVALDEMNQHLAGLEKAIAVATARPDHAWVGWVAIGLLVAAALWLAFLSQRMVKQVRQSQLRTDEAVQIAQETLKQQIKQAQTDLWRTLVREWNHEMLLDRKFFATYWKDPRMLKARYAKVMNFFETIGYLVHLQVVDPELCRQSFWHAFSGYSEACAALLQEDRKLNAGLYRHLFALKESWGIDPAITKEQGLVGFMSEESILAK
jgi:hypothetical protein